MYETAPVALEHRLMRRDAYHHKMIRRGHTIGKNGVCPDNRKVAVMESIVTVSGDQAPLAVLPGGLVLTIAAKRNIAVRDLEVAEFEYAPQDFTQIDGGKLVGKSKQAARELRRVVNDRAVQVRPCEPSSRQCTPRLCGSFLVSAREVSPGRPRRSSADTASSHPSRSRRDAGANDAGWFALLNPAAYDCVAPPYFPSPITPKLARAGELCHAEMNQSLPRGSDRRHASPAITAVLDLPLR